MRLVFSPHLFYSGADKDDWFFFGLFGGIPDVKLGDDSR
jgi:hypothetical protein